jgi:Putative zinc-finger
VVVKATGCRTIRQSLVLFADGELEPAVRLEIQEHLDGCADCRAEYEGVARVRGWLQDPELFAPVEDADWQQLPDRVKRQAAGAGQQVEADKDQAASGRVVRPDVWASTPRARRLIPSPGWALGTAASFLLACGLVWFVMRQAPPPAPVATVVPAAPSAPTAPGNAAFLGKMQAVYAKEQTLHYLSECEDLLLNLLHADQNCPTAGLDVSLEVDKARDLLQRKRRLDPELQMPEIARARGLCDELENFLVSVSTSEKCETPDRLRSFERSVTRQRLLLRINVLQAELS